MKKLFLLLSLGMISFGMMAREVPNIIVNKHDGGVWAIFNLYNNVIYTPNDGTTAIIGTLDCSGSGYSPCRVPRGNTLMATNPSTGLAINDNLNATLLNAVNELIEFSETQFNNRITRGEKSKTIAVQSSQNRGYVTYCLKARWSYDSRGNGTMIISIATGTLSATSRIN